MGPEGTLGSRLEIPPAVNSFTKGTTQLIANMFSRFLMQLPRPQCEYQCFKTVL